MGITATRNSNTAPYREQYRHDQAEFELTSLPVDRRVLRSYDVTSLPVDRRVLRSYDVTSLPPLLLTPGVDRSMITETLQPPVYHYD